MTISPEELERKYSELAEKIYQSVQTKRELANKTDRQIGELLFTFWGDLNMFSPQADLVEEAMERLGFYPEESEGDIDNV